jgi:hypothetical protein
LEVLPGLRLVAESGMSDAEQVEAVSFTYPRTSWLPARIPPVRAAPQGSSTPGEQRSKVQPRRLAGR